MFLAQNINCGYTFENEAVLTSTHNLFLEQKLESNVYPY